MVHIGISLFLALVAQSGPPGMQSRLSSEDPAALGLAARSEGDPARGAVVFHAPQLLCAKCHANGEKESVLGPDLARLGKDATDSYIVESILSPSKIIKKGYETITVATKAGKIVSGLLVADRPDAVVVRTSLLDDALTTIPKTEIDEQKAGGPSLMPSGLMVATAIWQDWESSLIAPEFWPWLVAEAVIATDRGHRPTRKRRGGNDVA